MRPVSRSARSTGTAGEIHVSSGPETGGIALAVEPSESLMALHRQLVAALQGRCETIYDMELTGTFRPHLTIVQQIPAATVAGAQELVARTPHRFSFPATEAVLVGRHGGRRWEPLRAAPIGSRGR